VRFAANAKNRAGFCDRIACAASNVSSADPFPGSPWRRDWVYLADMDGYVINLAVVVGMYREI
jgi:hypothetical protein